VVVKRIPPELECGPRLRELGILEGASLTLLRRSNPVLVLVKDSRIALDPATACAIEVALEAAV
jgi:Fe2+ transport system protein FeoA